jgi:thiol-disulfide isomerase/thioredoxin
MKKVIYIISVVVVLLTCLVALLQLSPANSGFQETEPTQSSTQTSDASQTETVLGGRYADYSSSLLAEAGYSETILFFHAAWCPECRAFEQAIKTDAIPDGVQVLKVDYDNSDDLRQKYEVTIQSTFVKVNTNGERVSTWVGYGRDKSLSAVLENT